MSLKRTEYMITAWLFRDSFGENEEGTCLLHIQDQQQIEVLPAVPPPGGGRFRTGGGSRLTHHTQTMDADLTPAGALPINSGKSHIFLYYFLLRTFYGPSE